MKKIIWNNTTCKVIQHYSLQEFAKIKFWLVFIFSICLQSSRTIATEENCPLDDCPRIIAPGQLLQRLLQRFFSVNDRVANRRVLTAWSYINLVISTSKLLLEILTNFSSDFNNITVRRMQDISRFFDRS